jgi:hypothetical protein
MGNSSAGTMPPTGQGGLHGALAGGKPPWQIGKWWKPPWQIMGTSGKRVGSSAAAVSPSNQGCTSWRRKPPCALRSRGPPAIRHRERVRGGNPHDASASRGNPHGALGGGGTPLAKPLVGETPLQGGLGAAGLLARCRLTSRRQRIEPSPAGNPHGESESGGNPHGESPAGKTPWSFGGRRKPHESGASGEYSHGSVADRENPLATWPARKPPCDVGKYPGTMPLSGQRRRGNK